MSTFIDCADNLACATLSGSNNINVNLQAGSPNKIVVSLSQSVVGLSKLEVTGNTIITDNSSNAALRITQTGAGEAIRVEDSANPDSTPFIVSSAGSVGIGTSSPSEKLEVANTTGFSTIKVTANTTPNTTDEASIRLFSGLNGYTYAFYRENSSNFGIYHSGSAGPATKFRINNNGMSLMEGGGNVGIGTTNPAAKLEVLGGASNDTIPELRISGSNGWIDFHNSLLEGSYAGLVKEGDKGIIFSEGTSNSGTFIISPWSNGSLYAGLRMDASGNVGIGTVAATGIKLHVASDGNNWIRSQAANGIPLFNTNRSNGTNASPTSVVNGDELGRFDVRGYNNSDFRQAAQISAVCTATPGGSDTAIASALYFKTSPGGTTAPQDRMIIDSAGNVGIGTIAPTNNLHISTTNDTIVRLVATANNVDTRLNSVGGAGNVGQVGTWTSHPFVIRTGDTERVRIDAAGNFGIGITPSTKLHVNGVITADSITFGSAGGTGTATGNTLSDYEEGTWTPTLKYGSNANSTITVTSAQYTKIGRTVTLGCEITVSTIVGTGQATLRGLPFAANSSTSAGGLFCIYFTGVSTVLNIVGKVTPSSSDILLYITNAAQATISNATNTHLQNGSNVIFRIVYDT